MDLWPRLAAIMYTGESGCERRQLREAAGHPQVLFMELALRLGLPVALEDPRHGLLRLLVDHGLFFEFAPPGQTGRSRWRRYPAAQVERGVTYDMALSAPTGLWSCLANAPLRFESVNPPLFRMLEKEQSLKQAARAPQQRPAHPFPTQAPHWPASESLPASLGSPGLNLTS
jgi:hypothetical protein